MIHVLSDTLARPLSLFGLALLTAPAVAQSAPPPGGGVEPPEPVSFRITASEALPLGASGVARNNKVATFGFPLAEGEVFLYNARPALSVPAASSYQFRTLEQWPDGSVKWALCDVRTTVAAGGSKILVVKDGNGKSPGQASVAQATMDEVVLDTGPLRAVISRNAFNLFDEVDVNGNTLVDSPSSPGVYALTTTGDVLTPGVSTVVIVESNGPTRAVVRADGALEDTAGNEIVDFTCRITVRRGSRDVQVDFTIRNADETRDEHLELEAIELEVETTGLGGSIDATVPLHGSQGDLVTPLPNVDADVYFYQAGSDAPVTDLGSDQYYPHIPKLSPGTGSPLLSETGYRVVFDDGTQGGGVLFSTTDSAEYPEHGFLKCTGNDGGVTVAIRHMPHLWPAALEAHGDGRVVAGLFTKHNQVPYRFLWRQHESRTAVFSFHSGAGGGAEAVAQRLDWPFTGRMSNYDRYDEAGVFPYRLMTVAEQEAVYADIGITGYPIDVDDVEMQITRYLYARSSGGFNNHPNIEDRLATRWLRHGSGGDYINALDHALYKSEWQVLRSDGFDDAGQTASNEATFGPKTEGNFSDEDHRYREGMILAWYLTGDSRYREALDDEVEVLINLANYENTRSMSQSLRAQALLYELTGDAGLQAKLEDRIDHWGNAIVDLSSPGGFGWEAPPGLGQRRYYVKWNEGCGHYASDVYYSKGFFAGTLAPIALFHGARAIDRIEETSMQESDLDELARGRLEDLAFWTREELYGVSDDLNVTRLVECVDVPQDCVIAFDQTNFHPILLGMGEAYLQTGDIGYLQQGIQQVRAFWFQDTHGEGSDLFQLDTRLECQHFFSILAESMIVTPADALLDDC